MSEKDPTKTYLEANRSLWNEWTTINAASDFYRLEEFIEGGIELGRGIRLREYEIDDVGPVKGKSLLHLQCHFGLDTLSWARLGAVVTGADFSPEGIRKARWLAAEVGLEARFVLSDLFDLPSKLQGDFDIVYTSRGVLGWLPDLARWGQVVAHFLKPGGIFYISEIHPVAHVFDDEDDATKPRLRFPYYEKGTPIEFPVQGSYADRTAAMTQEFEYYWPHSMAEIVTSLCDAGLRIEFLHELPFAEWPLPFLQEHDDGTWRFPSEQTWELPLWFSIKATKPG